MFVTLMSVLSSLFLLFSDLGSPSLKTMEPGPADGKFGEIPYRSYKQKPSLATSLLYLFYERPF